MHLYLWFIQQTLTLPGVFGIDSVIYWKGKRAQEKGLETGMFLGCKLLILHPHFFVFLHREKNAIFVLQLQFKPIKMIFYFL